MTFDSGSSGGRPRVSAVPTEPHMHAWAWPMARMRHEWRRTRDKYEYAIRCRSACVWALLQPHIRQ